MSSGSAHIPDSHLSDKGLKYANTLKKLRNWAEYWSVRRLLPPSPLVFVTLRRLVLQRCLGAASGWVETGGDAPYQRGVVLADRTECVKLTQSASFVHLHLNSGARLNAKTADIRGMRWRGRTPLAFDLSDSGAYFGRPGERLRHVRGDAEQREGVSFKLQTINVTLRPINSNSAWN